MELIGGYAAVTTEGGWITKDPTEMADPQNEPVVVLKWMATTFIPDSVAKTDTELTALYHPTEDVFEFSNDIVASQGVLYELGMKALQSLTDLFDDSELQLFPKRFRKMRARWAMEAQQDLRAMYNVDLAAILARQMQRDLTNEIDREVLLSAGVTIPSGWTGLRSKLRQHDGRIHPTSV